MTVIISRWGNSLGIRIPKAALEEAWLHEGDKVDVLAEDGKLIVRKTTRRSLAELVAAITPENRHAEQYWPPVGAEEW